MVKQLNHEECKKLHKKFKSNMIFVLENFEHEENIGSAFRLADAFNIESVIIVSKNQINLKKALKTARNCEKYINYHIVEEIDDALKIVEEKGFKPICVDYTSHSTPLREVDFAQDNGVALIMGNERNGVSEETLQKVEKSVHIDMYGNNSSMNVSTALAIVAYKASEDLLKKYF